MLAYLKQFIRHPMWTGAVAPMSREFAVRMAREGKVGQSRVIVEFGTGNGVVTEQILGQKQQASLFIALEINPYFAAKTRKRCPQALVYLDSAEHVRKYLKRHSAEKVDCIISTMPWSNFSDEFQEKLLQTIVDVLKPGGRFLTAAYIHTPLFFQGKKFRDKLHAKFSRVGKTRIEWKNLPPVFAYNCGL